jgi:hypothetical protein
MTLQRLILTFKPEEGAEIQTLYRSKDGPGPNTKGRMKRSVGPCPDRLRASPGGLRGACGRCRDVGIHDPGRYRLMYSQR